MSNEIRGGDVQQILDVLSSSIGSRHEAADILRHVADAGQSGNWPSEVTCEQLGWALHRIAINAPVEDPLLGIITGWRMRERERRT